MVIKTLTVTDVDAVTNDHREKRGNTCKIFVPNEQVVFFPLRVYGHTCLGILFTSPGSIRGRRTTVFCVLDHDDPTKKVALKTSWQLLEQVESQDAITKRLKEHKLHPNVIVPLELSHAERNDMTCTTLCGIRGFVEEDLAYIDVENRVLTVSISELKRPVAYFWGLHDFVRGLRGALLGHQFLTNIGILHRDISENNIVLGVYPWQERGYLIDFDSATLQAPIPSTKSADESDEAVKNSFTKQDDKHVNRVRTGTFPYISFGVLTGMKHTYFDDVESFLYVLLFFLLSYAGPLPKTELENAHKNGFVRPIGSGPFSHARSCPEVFARWADSNVKFTAYSKASYVFSARGPLYLLRNADLQDCLKNNWPEDFQFPICSLLKSTFTVFTHMAGLSGRPEVSHAQFIKILDEWLATNSALEDEYSHCPNFLDDAVASRIIG